MVKQVYRPHDDSNAVMIEYNLIKSVFNIAIWVKNIKTYTEKKDERFLVRIYPKFTKSAEMYFGFFERIKAALERSIISTQETDRFFLEISFKNIICKISDREINNEKIRTQKYKVKSVEKNYALSESWFKYTGNKDSEYDDEEENDE